MLIAGTSLRLIDFGMFLRKKQKYFFYLVAWQYCRVNNQLVIKTDPRAVHEMFFACFPVLFLSKRLVK